jgi:hypothetical protein
MKGRCNEREVRGKRNIIVLGALEVRKETISYLPLFQLTYLT